MSDAQRDQNHVPSALGVSSVDGFTTIPFTIDPITGRLLVDASGGSGTVTTVSVVTNQGVSGSVANATTTPAITLSLGALTGVTSFNGLVVTANTGTITTGTWNGTKIAVGYGGTNLTTIAALSILVANSLDTFLALTPGAGQSIRINAGNTAWEAFTPAAAASSVTIGTTTIVSGTTTRILYDNAGILGEYTITGTGTVVAMQTSPSLLTSLLMDTGFVMNWASSNVVLTHTSGILTLGTGTLKITTPTNTSTSVVTIDGTQSLTNKTYNGNTWTAGTGVLTIAAAKTLTVSNTLTLAGTDGKTLTISNSITLAGTDATVMTFPTTSATIARTDAGQTFTGVNTFTSPAITTSITTGSTTFTAFAGATTILTIGGTGATAVFAIPGTLEQSTTTGALTVAGGVYIAKKLLVAGTLSTTSPDLTTSITTPSTTFALVNATATTINFAGAATTLNIGASATCVLNFGGSTVASEFRFLEPSGSGTNYTAFKAQAQGANITYTLPATVGGANTFLTDVAGNGTLSWGTPGGSSGPMTLLKANSGASTTTTSNNLDTISITGLTALDTIVIYYTLSQDGGGVGAASGPLYIYNSTDSLNIMEFTDGNNVAGGNTIGGNATLQQEKTGSTIIFGTNTAWNNSGIATGGNAASAQYGMRYRSSTATTAWTGSWTLALHSDGQTAAGTLNWSWKVFKIAGQ